MSTTHEQSTPDLLTKADVADHLRVSPDTVDRYVRRGLLRAYRLPHGQPRFRRTDVLALLSHRPGSPDAA